MAMAEQVEAALQHPTIFLAEAGTGIGKTYAYLLPALLSGKKILISTASKSLQDQLFYKDLPTLSGVVPQTPTVTLLKGRSNYLCRQRIDRFVSGGHTLKEMQQVADLGTVLEFMQHTTSGDINDIETLAEHNPIWPHVTSDADNCLGHSCDFFKTCFVYQARQRAQRSTIVIINHHLFFADTALKESGFAELIPEFDAIIFDEAHTLADIATQFFGTRLSSRQLNLLAQDIEWLEGEGAELVELKEQAKAVMSAVKAMRQAFGAEPERCLWQRNSQQQAVSTAADQLQTQLQQLVAVLEIWAGHSEKISHAHQRAQELLVLFQRLTTAAGEKEIHWFETFKHSFSLHLTPLTLESLGTGMVNHPRKTWILTSATLTIAGKFDVITAQLGLKEVTCARFTSPFDYREQALLYLPRHLPAPTHPDYSLQCAQAMLPVLTASRGRAFYLFTSHRALQQVANYLKQMISFPILVQGEATKSHLLAQFRAQEHAVLLGAASFWAGVDVSGEALSCVIIEKLPFAMPKEPILEAKINRIQQAGGDAFLDLQLPQAAIQLQQGMGRLIRSVSDKGVLVICDPRLTCRWYGALFFQSLPAGLPKTRTLARVQHFFQPETID